jgi:predicted nucleotidyltransferase
MKTFDATSAKNRFGQLLEACAHAPVAIARHGRVVAYLVGPKEFSAAPVLMEDRLAGRLREAGAVYATVFGSVARGQARADSDIDVAVSFGKPMSSDLRMAVIGIAAAVSGRSADVIDLEAAGGLVLARALGGREIHCDDVATRQRMIAKVRRSEDERLSAALAVRAARARLFA